MRSGSRESPITEGPARRTADRRSRRRAPGPGLRLPEPRSCSPDFRSRSGRGEVVAVEVRPELPFRGDLPERGIFLERQQLEERPPGEATDNRARLEHGAPEAVQGIRAGEGVDQRAVAVRVQRGLTTAVTSAQVPGRPIKRPETQSPSTSKRASTGLPKPVFGSPDRTSDADCASAGSRSARKRNAPTARTRWFIA